MGKYSSSILEKSFLAELSHLNLLCQVAGNREARAADIADQVPTIGQLTEAHLLTEPEVPQLIAIFSRNKLHPQIATRRRLIQRHGAIDFNFGGGNLHRLLQETLIETHLQQQKGDREKIKSSFALSFDPFNSPPSQNLWVKRSEF